MSFLDEAIEKITAQQPERRTAVWMVGEHLKDMIRGEPGLAEIVAQDLNVKDMSLANCEKKIKEFADKHKTGRFACVLPDEAERIIWEFYGLPVRGEGRIDTPTRNDEVDGGFVDLAEFF